MKIKFILFCLLWLLVAVVLLFGTSSCSVLAVTAGKAHSTITTTTTTTTETRVDSNRIETPKF